MSCAAFLSSSATRCHVSALQSCNIVAFSWPQLEALVQVRAGGWGAEEGARGGKGGGAWMDG